jgi:uncharacterized protein with LGFP repeats
MINFRNAMAALALAVAVAAAVSPATAAQKHRAANPGHAARAQALPAQQAPGGGTMAPERERALRECSEAANKLVQKDWGVMQNTTMNSCMLSHGQMQ